jgi:UDP-glucose 4-epimerase
MAILVTGGAGYIGSHMVHALLDRGDDVVVLDNLSTGVRALVAERAAFVEGNVADGELVSKIVKQYGVTAVIHFAGSVIVPESVADPLAYYRNNTAASRNLIEACVKNEVGNFVFSSTAAVYGMPEQIPVAENTPLAPINPYGRSKLMTEWMLEDCSRAYDLRFVALRYFNVAGADPKGRTGQSTPRATHLIKRACQAALGRVPALEIFGTDYPTKDGTGVRDYIHVSDLANAHIHALDHLEVGGDSIILNCCYGHGFSVREVVETVSRVSGNTVPTKEAPRRAGDPASVVADPTKIKEIFEWQPKFDDLDEIVLGAYAWERGLNSV